MGGMLALDWAFAAPSQIKSLTLINSSSAGLSPLWQRFKTAELPERVACTGNQLAPA